MLRGTPPVHQWELLACSLAELSSKDGFENGESSRVSVVMLAVWGEERKRWVSSRNGDKLRMRNWAKPEKWK